MIIGAYGVPHSGKTACITMLVAEAAKSGRPIFIADTHRSFARWPRTFASVRYWRSALTQTGKPPLVSVFTFATPPGTAESRAGVLEVAALVGERGGTLVVDEIGFSVNQRGDLPPEVARIVLTGFRTPQCGLIYGSQFASLVHRYIRDHTEVFYVFRQRGSTDLEVISDDMQPHGDRIAELAPTLKNLDYVRFRSPPDEEPTVRTLQVAPWVFAGRERS